MGPGSPLGPTGPGRPGNPWGRTIWGTHSLSSTLPLLPHSLYPSTQLGTGPYDKPVMSIPQNTYWHTRASSVSILSTGTITTWGSWLPCLPLRGRNLVRGLMIDP